ncbi:hypothetical protein LXL04_014266 [Taraxacum kok-saghyz]
MSLQICYGMTFHSKGRRNTAMDSIFVTKFHSYSLTSYGLQFHGKIRSKIATKRHFPFSIDDRNRSFTFPSLSRRHPPSAVTNTASPASCSDASHEDDELDDLSPERPQRATHLSDLIVDSYEEIMKEVSSYLKNVGFKIRFIRPLVYFCQHCEWGRRQLHLQNAPEVFDELECEPVGPGALSLPQAQTADLISSRENGDSSLMASIIDRERNRGLMSRGLINRINFMKFFLKKTMRFVSDLLLIRGPATIDGQPVDSVFPVFAINMAMVEFGVFVTIDGPSNTRFLLKI